MYITETTKIMIVNHLLITENDKIIKLANVLSKPIPKKSYAFLIWLCELYDKDPLVILHNKTHPKEYSDLIYLFIYFQVLKNDPLLIKNIQFNISNRQKAFGRLNIQIKELQEILPYESMTIRFRLTRCISKIKNDKKFSKKVEALENILIKNNWFHT